MFLRHSFGKGFAAKDVEMEMLYGLTSIITAVGDDAIAVGNACGLGNLGNLFKDFGYDHAVVGGDSVNRRNMLLGNHEHVNGGLRIDVVKCEDIVVFIRFFGRDLTCNDFTENTHKLIPSLSLLLYNRFIYCLDLL